MADQSQKTEQATPRRMEKARREGQFPEAKELVGAAQFLVFLSMLSLWGGRWLSDMRGLTRELLLRGFHGEATAAGMASIQMSIFRRAVLPLLAAGGALVLVSVAIRLATTRFGFSLNKLAPDLKRLSPAAKIKGLPRQNIPAALQAIVLLPVFFGAVYAVASDNLVLFLKLPLNHVEAGAHAVAASISDLMWKAGGAFVALGLVDMARQRLRYRKDMRMSRQEIRDEHKELEGNPQYKARIRRLGRELLRRRMMQEVPTATAVIVNPTHFAVALRYQFESMAAPVVVAKGKNYLALRIRQRAVENLVPIIENPPLAQALYKSAEVGQEIPVHLYRAVAEILAYIYRLTNRK